MCVLYISINLLIKILAIIYIIIQMNYQPAAWDGSDTVSADNFADNFAGNFADNVPSSDFIQNQGYSGGAIHDDRLDDHTSPVDRRWIDRDGKHCRIVCTPAPRPRPSNPQFIARQIMGIPIQQRTLAEVLRRFPPNSTGVPIRVVIRNGQQLPVTQDFNRNRINVETRTYQGREFITRIVGFY